MSDAKRSERIQIETDEDNKTVHAVLLVTDEKLEYSDSWLDEQLALQNYKGLSVAENTRKELADLVNSNTAGKLILGKKVDAKADVIISRDKISASLRITSAQGGQQVGTKEVLNALHAKDIDLSLVIKKRVVGLIRKSLIITPGETTDIIVAKGEVPIHGEDTQFKCLLDNLVDRKPQERADGSIDYYDLGELVSVAEGTALMRKKNPTLAKNGRSVTGEGLLARLGKSLNFKKCKGAEVSLSDPDLLLASIKGQPVLIKQGMNVDSLYTVKAVDVHSGHVDYDGSVIVKGDVVSGMKIKVTGDVQVFGMVENASIDAGGNIDIKLGAVGHVQTAAKSQEGMEIRCAGNLSAAYLENATVHVGGDVLIKSRVSNCELKAGHQVIVGNQRQKKSGIVGGHVTAGSLIRTEVLGSSGGALTTVGIVCHEDTVQKFEQLKQDIVQHDELLVGKLGAMVGLSKKHTEEAKQSLAALRKETDDLKATVNDLIEQKDEIAAILEQVKLGRIIVQKEAFSGVAITISDQETVVKTRYGNGSFFLDNGAISHSAAV